MPKSGRKPKNPGKAGGNKVLGQKVAPKRSIATRSGSVVAMEPVSMGSTGPFAKKSRVVKQIQFDEIDGNGKNNNALPVKGKVKNKRQLQEMSKELLTAVGDGVTVRVREGDEVELNYYDDLINDDSSGSSMATQEEFVEEPRNMQQHVPHDGNKAQTIDLNQGMDELLANPKLKNLFNKMWDERIKEVQSHGETSSSAVLTTPTGPATEGNHGNGKQTFVKTVNAHTFTPQQKSPSDTTIYAPALNKTAVTAAQQIGTPLNNQTILVNDRHVNDVANFIEAVRAEQAVELLPPETLPGEPNPVKSRISVLGQEDAMKRTEKSVLEAEKFRAAVEIPPVGEYHGTGEGFRAFHDDQRGMRVNNDEGTNLTNLAELFTQFATMNRPQIGSGLTDDDFFHLTSHIDVNLRQKIEKGLYVDLDRLVPRDRSGVFDPMGVQMRIALNGLEEMGGTFLEPARKSSRITNFRRWEQAFRVYATIYCGCNPGRSKEMWQYISIINTAASSYTWENVYSYDVVFRQLMEFNPARSWAVTYNQMWNLSMRDPLQKFSPRGASNPNLSATPPTSGGKKGGYCWNFNRGVKCKYGSKCKYKERCSYCDAINHGVNICPKITQREHSPAATKSPSVASSVKK